MRNVWFLDIEKQIMTREKSCESNTDRLITRTPKKKMRWNKQKHVQNVA